MQIEEKLLFLSSYYTALPKVGHTHALIHGIANTERVMVLTQTHEQGQAIQRQCASFVHLMDLDHLHLLFGKDNPLVIDNEALSQLFKEAVDEIWKLKRENSDLHARLALAENRVSLGMGPL